MKVISWNIDICPSSNKGLLSQGRLERILDEIHEQKADVIIIQESNDCFANKLKSKLGNNYRVCIHEEFENSNVKVLMAYKIIDEHINIKLYDKTNGKDFAYTRWIELSYKEIEIVGLHASLPENIEDRLRKRQKAFWKRILKYADARKESKNTLLIGDFNVYEKTAVSNKPSKAYEDFKWLQDEGWKVLKTKRINDFSYCNSGCWDRQLDYALVSPKFKYEYTLEMFRFEKLSDHEMLVVQLDIK